MPTNESFPAVTPKSPDYMPNRLVDKLTMLALAAAIGFAAARLTEPSPSQNNTIRTAQQEVLAFNAAQQQADGYTKVINDSIGKSMPIGMQILFGTVAINTGESPRDTTKKTNLRPAYKDPILLSTVNHPTYDAKGHFLNGGYIGLQTTDSNGQVVITSVPYNSQTMIFTPDNRQQPVLDVSVYATTTDNHNLYQAHQLIGFDPAGNVQLKHLDQSPINPGTIISQF